MVAAVAVASMMIPYQMPELDPLCACRDGFSPALVELAVRYPNDRLALISSLQDATISNYYGESGPAFQNDLLSLATDVIDEIPSAHYFYVPGTRHTFLLSGPATGIAQGVDLVTWLGEQIDDSAGWVSE